MDLYEALKAGTSAEELLTAFHKELDEASERIAAETKASEHDEYLEEARYELAEAIATYTEAFLGDDLEDEVLSVEDIEQVLVKFEDEMANAIKFQKKLESTLQKAKEENKKPIGVKITTRSLNDDDVIARFLKSLK